MTGDPASTEATHVITINELATAPSWTWNYIWVDKDGERWSHEEARGWCFQSHEFDDWLEGYPREGWGPYTATKYPVAWAKEKHPQSDYCQHGTYIGSVSGPDYICGKCESGD